MLSDNKGLIDSSRLEIEKSNQSQLKFNAFHLSQFIELKLGEDQLWLLVIECRTFSDIPSNQTNYLYHKQEAISPNQGKI